MFKQETESDISDIVEKSMQAFHIYRQEPLSGRRKFMKGIADELMANRDQLVATAMEETNLPEARLRSELGRTVLQLEQYGEACERGDWLEARIDTARKELKAADIRKMLVPLGPVVVFGASNFPFAYSTAGGDTACAFAAGCSVIVKGHPAHLKTSVKVSEAIQKAIKSCKLPEGLFSHVTGSSFETGRMLVMHPGVAAVGFTGSLSGGRQLFDWGNQREKPIPVFAEMGSVNPVFLLPEKLSQSADEIATLYAGSITTGVGQFCTNPGLIVGIESEDLHRFTQQLGENIEKIAPQKMLHTGIADSFIKKRDEALKQKGVEIVAKSGLHVEMEEGRPLIATVAASVFLENPLLHQEVFGPFSLIIRCADIKQMVAVAASLEGQLTSTVMATHDEASQNVELVATIQDICGRFVMNDVPTGVRVCRAMQHGGPYPATTDSRFTAVGADGIKRFARPLAFQNWPDRLLPAELQNLNPLKIWRIVNGEFTKEAMIDESHGS